MMGDDDDELRGPVNPEMPTLERPASAALEHGRARLLAQASALAAASPLPADAPPSADGHDQTEPEPVAGHVFEGRYDLAEVLGRGSFGVVYRGIQSSTGQQVAIKLFRLESWLAGEEASTAVRRFRRETQLSASLHHPNIVRLIDAGTTDGGRPYSVFEYVPGVTLGAYLAERTRLSLAEATRLLGQVLDALAAAHRVGVVHRDLKPENIMITRSGVRDQAKVLDFGIGALLDSAGIDATTLTEAHRFVGTPAYAAPEQLRAERATTASDLYAWALVFIEAVTGERVMSGGSVGIVVGKQLDPTPVPLPAILEGTELGALVSLMLSRDVRARTITAAEAVRRLSTLEASTGPHEPDAPATASLDEAGRHNQRQLAVAACEAHIETSAQLDLETYDARLRACRRAAAQAAREAGGLVIDDGRLTVVACFGVTQAREDDVRRAAQTARAMLAAIAATEPTHPGLWASAGVHVGLAIAGHAAEGGMATPSGFAIDGALELAHRAPRATVWVSQSAAAFVEGWLEPDPAEVLALPGEPSSPCFALAARIRGPSDDRERTTFVGRDDEMLTLRQRWAKAREGSGQAVVVIGEAGMGKSRLMAELRRELDAQTSPPTWLECQCARDDEGRMLRPFEALLDAVLMDGKSMADERLGALDEGLARLGLREEREVLALLLGLPIEAPALPPDALRSRTLDAVVQVLLTMAEERPLILAVEDLHWSDPTTLELLGLLIGQLDASPLLLVTTCRPELSIPWGQQGGHRVVQLPLAGLPPAAVRAVALGREGAMGLSDTLLDAIVERTDGVPYFVEELVEELVRRGARDSAAIVEQGIPPTLRGLLGARLDALESSRETAQLAAALGVEFDADWLHALGDDQEQVEGALAELVAADLLRRRRRGRSVSYRFRHALVRDVAYDSMIGSVRRDTHRRIADVLEQRFEQLATPRPDLLAHHRAAAGQRARAVPHALAAARMALKRSAYVEANGHASRGLAWLEAITDERTRDERELELGVVRIPALIATQGWFAPELLQTLERSRQILDRVGPSPHAFAVHWYLALLMTFSGREEAIERTRELCLHAERGGDSVEIAAACALLGQCHFVRGEYREGHEPSARTVELWDVERHGGFVFSHGLDPYTTALLYLGHRHYQLGQERLARDHIERAVTSARKLGHLHSLAGVLYGSSTILIEADDREGVRRLAGELVSLCDDHELMFFLQYGQLMLAWANEDVEGARAAIDGLTAMGVRTAMPLWSSYLADLELCAGLADAAEDHLRGWLPLIDELGSGTVEARLLHLDAEIRLARGDRQGALERLRAAVDRGIARETFVFAVRAALAWSELEPDSAPARTALERAYAGLHPSTTLAEAATARQWLGRSTP